MKLLQKIFESELNIVIIIIHKQFWGIDRQQGGTLKSKI